MNQLRSWLYGHNSYTQDKNEEHSQDVKKHLENIGRNKSESSESTLRSVLLCVVPLAPGDCLECKLVGTGVMMVSGVMVAVSAVTARRRNPKLSGFNGAVYYLLCGSMFLGFEATAYCRLFDVGPFHKNRGEAVMTTKQ